MPPTTSMQVTLDRGKTVKEQRECYAELCNTIIDNNDRLRNGRFAGDFAIHCYLSILLKQRAKKWRQTPPKTKGTKDGQNQGDVKEGPPEKKRRKECKE